MRLQVITHILAAVLSRSTLETFSPLGNQLENQSDNQLDNRLEDQLDNQLDDELDDQLDKQLDDQLGELSRSHGGLWLRRYWV